ncbi:hypothetical protein WA1_24145 [Scytonema hofmannii PCC 7110]|uniref:Uncharacterized protein n=1 Tax=Scytonema hofmannii PCC 7110 TaxID=128403 RepID=A0A139X7R3_9CYAN|nr:type V CRISPR-associated protein Cas12k [Scytonema hofmannii]KYC40734.1 hypothetical protein WA1_24145 [Scytonema hofmannii PCC 7110]USN26947.1 hypothetical protein [synthetic construct]
MSTITIQCRLVAEEATLRYFWELMAEKNTPLINELLEQLGQHPDFDTWVQAGKMPEKTVENLCKSLEDREPFANQPGRFRTSAVALVKYIYKSWFALQKRRADRLEGKERWLKMLKSDVELERESNCSLDIIRAKAGEILAKVTEGCAPSNQTSSKRKKKKTKKSQATKDLPTLFEIILKAYEQAEESLTRAALAYLLKNDCEVSEVDEDSEKFKKRRRKKEIEIERLRNQLKSRIPKGRDLTGDKWLKTLEEATRNVPENEDEAKAWQAQLLREASSVPFPVAYETSEDMTWFTNEQGRIFVYFNGSAKHKFQVYCDRRQLHWFQRFVEDFQIKKNGDKKGSEKEYPAGLLTLCSTRLRWKESAEKGDPWNVHRLILSCTIDTRLWTLEGTEQVRAEKIAQVEKTISKREQEVNLSKTQLERLQAKHSERERLNNIFPNRPSKPSYRGKSHIAIGVSFSLENPATVAVVDVATKKVLTYRSFKQLLGDNYNLANRLRQQKQRLSHERHKAQKQGAPNSFGDSELGQYVDRLLAKSIVAIAKTYQASSIVLPKLRYMREIIHNEVQAKAEKKIPGYKEGQKQYAKQYRISVHQWSYNRLSQILESQATKAGISIERGSQVIQGSSQEQARDLALFAYNERQLSLG